MSETGVEFLRIDVLRFRRALEACLHSLDRTIFGNFPHGCCGAVSEILAIFLHAQGHGTFVYVCGLKFDDSRSFSHAWLEQEGCIVDITLDQFDRRSEHTFVTVDRSWHDSRFPEQRKQGPFSKLSPELCVAYAHIQEELESRSKTS